MKAASRRVAVAGGRAAVPTRTRRAIILALRLAPIHVQPAFKSQLYTVYFVLARHAIVKDTFLSVLFQIKRRKGMHPEYLPLT